MMPKIGLCAKMILNPKNGNWTAWPTCGGGCSMDHCPCKEDPTGCARQRVCAENLGVPKTEVLQSRGQGGGQRQWAKHPANTSVFETVVSS
jgi:hypothetical protein